MRDLLVPIFGDWGAVVAQFIITVVIVLALIGAVWWFVRRYSGVHFGGIGRGRVPRLAIVDVLAVDRRRRLVLVRRDNIEHLLLIGGPSDVVVEGAIHRVRQRGTQTAAQIAAAQAAAARAALQTAIEPPPAAEAEPFETAAAGQPPANMPIPFPVARSAQRQAEPGPGRPELRSVQPPPAPAAAAEEEPAAVPPTAPGATFVEPQRPTRLQAMRRPVAPPPPVAAVPEAAPPEAAPLPEAAPPPAPVAEEPADESLILEVMTAEAEPLPAPPPTEPAPATFAEAEREAAEEARQSALDLGDMEALAMTAEQEEAIPTAPDEVASAPPESADRVSDLEREMARLLDEITTRRSS